MKVSYFFLIAFLLVFYIEKVKALQDTTININIDANKVIGKVNKNIYGHLLEHIYHSVNGGLWGEMLASRSFEPEGANGWYLNKDEVVSTGTRISKLLFGKQTWTDYEITGKVMWEPYFVGVPAPWSGGQSDISFIFRNSADSLAYAFHLNAASSPPFLLEKFSTGKSKPETAVLKAVSSPPEALIKSRRWHQFNIKCNKNEITVFIDNHLILKFTDEQNPILSGNIGLLLTKTSARFKNIQVKSLEGKMLWQGLPDEVKPAPVAPDWLSFGNGKFVLSNGNVKNGNYAQKITVVNGKAGVKQRVFNLNAQENYTGSIWLHGDKGLKLSVYFKDGDKILAQTVIGQVSTKWKKYYFRLRPDVSAAKGDFVLAVEGNGRIWLDQASLMSESSENNSGYQPNLYKAVSQLQPAHLRWPGGSYASGYDWMWGIGPQENRVRLAKPSWNDFEQNAFGTDEFLKLCKNLGSEPVIVIRIGYDQPDSLRPKLIKNAQNWLQYCNGAVNTPYGKLRSKNGHPQPYNVKYWEIDNEMWELGVEKYGELLREFVPALKKIDPAIKIIACGDFTEKGKNKDSVLFHTSGNYFDYISLHHYENPSRFLEGPMQIAEKYKQEEKWIAASTNPAIKLYISEWNASETDWRTGLYAGGILNVFEKDTNIAMAAAALLLRRTDATGWNNAFINFDGNNWFPAPNYVVTKLYREHFEPNLIALTGDAGPINAVATCSNNYQKVVVKIVNPVNYPVKINLSFSNFNMPDSVKLYLIAPGQLKAANTLAAPDVVKPEKINIKNTANTCTYVLPALAIGVFELDK